MGDVDGAPLGIDIDVTDEVVMSNGASINANTFGAGAAGAVVVEATALTLTIGALISGATVTVMATDEVEVRSDLARKERIVMAKRAA